MRPAIAGTATFLGLLLLLADCGGGNNTPADVPGTSPPTPIVPEEELLARDAERLRELALLQAALAEYRELFGGYPSTAGRVQTLCRFQELDNGCDLKEVLSEEEQGILQDPVSPDGYSYASDGETYTIWMLNEAPANPGDPVCAEIDPHLKDKGPLFCVTADASP